MGIAIEPRARSAPPTAAGPNPPPDGYLDSVAKLVPGEVLAGFFAALQAPGVDGERTPHAVILAIFTVLTPLLLWSSARRTGTAVPWLQYVVRTTAFVLVAAGADPVLLTWLERLRWIPSVGAIAIVVLSAAILTPPVPRGPPVP